MVTPVHLDLFAFAISKINLVEISVQLPMFWVQTNRLNAINLLDLQIIMVGKFRKQKKNKLKMFNFWSSLFIFTLKFHLSHFMIFTKI